MKKVKKKKTSKKAAPTKKEARPAQAKTQNARAARAGREATGKVRSAAAHIGKTTKKMVDDVFLKVLGMKVLARAQEITQSLQKEKRSRKKARS